MLTVIFRKERGEGAESTMRTAFVLQSSSRNTALSTMIRSRVRDARTSVWHQPALPTTHSLHQQGGNPLPGASQKLGLTPW